LHAAARHDHLTGQKRVSGLPNDSPELLLIQRAAEWVNCQRVCIGYFGFMQTVQQEQVSVRLDPKLRDVVLRAAKEERRTVSSLVRNIIDDWARASRAREVA
jgi:hypothetical protein